MSVCTRLVAVASFDALSVHEPIYRSCATKNRPATKADCRHGGIIVVLSTYGVCEVVGSLRVAISVVGLCRRTSGVCVCVSLTTHSLADRSALCLKPKQIGVRRKSPVIADYR